VTAALDGQVYLARCGAPESVSWLRCFNTLYQQQQLSPNTRPYPTQDCVNRDDTVTIGGPPGAVYDVTLRVRGVVAPKSYATGAPGSPVNGTNYGWFIGGRPVDDRGNLFILWVSSPVVTPSGTMEGQYYFLNALNRPELTDFSFPVDYTVTLPIAAGAEVRFLADDSDCLMNNNCDDSSIDGYMPPMAVCNPSTIPDLPASAGITQPYLGQFLYLTVVSAVTR
jgi:hypothetical protein